MRVIGVLAVSFTLLGASAAAQARPKAAGVTDAAARWQAFDRHEQLMQDSVFAGLKWRSIGPTVQGGRVVEIAPVPGEPFGFYVAYASGGVWKTANNGLSFEPLTDQLPSMVIGAIAVDPLNPKRLWVGSGEPNSSRSSYGGLGMFRSDDGGKTFQRAGLDDTDRIARIVVDPADGNHVCVAALGRLFSDGGGRGIYCSDDAGRTWTLALKGDNARTGFVDLAFDPKDGNVMYAAAWERSRKSWEFVEGGKGSGLYKSSDRGRTWARVAGGFPGGEKIGRIGLAVSNTPGVLYANVDNWNPLPESQQDLGDRPVSGRRLRTMTKAEFLRQDPEEIESFIRSADLDTELDAKKLIEMVKKDELTLADLVKQLGEAEAALFDTDIRGLEVYRSDDAGATWRRTHEYPLREVTYTYGYYFGQIRVAPDDANRLYVLGVPVITSKDGGRTWSGLNHPKVHVDHHALWIDPAHPERIALGNDGGIDLTYDGGKSWIKLDAQPVGQFYTVMVDHAEPYNVYGGLQDNGTLKGSSTTRWELGQDWTQIGGGDGMYVAVDTRDNQTTYTGYQFGHYARSGPGGRHELRPRAKLRDTPYRFNWNTPVVLSPHHQDVVYMGTNKLMRSLDKGETWTALSGDLTVSQNRGDVPFATLTTISESPLQFGLVWAGTDDGQVWVSEGTEFRNVAGSLPADRWVSRVEASRHVKPRAYVSLNGHRDDDMSAYLYASEDLGRSWRSIGAGLPAEPINVVREDPVNADVLYVGTDRGVYVSSDRGASWQGLGGNLPNVPVHDLIVHPRERELVAGTHGRSVWIVDVLPVQELTAKARDEAVKLYPVETVQADRDWRGRPSEWFDEGPYLPTLDLAYWAKGAGKGTLTVLDGDKHPLRVIELQALRGVNSLSWDLTVERKAALEAENAAVAKVKDADKTDEGALAKTPYAESVRLGHRLFIAPGTYTLKLALNGAESETKLEVKAPEARPARAKAKPKMRGKDGYASPMATPEARAASGERD